MPGCLVIEPYRLLPVRVVEVDGPVDHARVGVRAPHHLDERDEVRRVERMPHHEARRVRESGLELRHDEARGRAGHDHVRPAGRRRVPRRASASRRASPARSPARSRRRGRPRRGTGVEGEPIGARAVRNRIEPFEGGPGAVDERAQRRLSFRARVPRLHVHSTGEEVRGPGRSDGAGADDADAIERMNGSPGSDGFTGWILLVGPGAVQCLADIAGTAPEGRMVCGIDAVVGDPGCTIRSTPSPGPDVIECGLEHDAQAFQLRGR